MADLPQTDLLQSTPRGFYCPPGDFYIDPWEPVDRAVVTHAHADHLTRGSARYLVSAEGEALTRARLWDPADVQGLPYGEEVVINGVRVSFHPAGHVLGSAQVRLEKDGFVAVVSGDYKTDADPTCAPFEPVRCDLFVTECTFGLPVYRWPSTGELSADVNAWWAENAAEGRASIVFAYSLGKAQRVLAGLDPSIGPIYEHGAPFRLSKVYRAEGKPIPETAYVGEGVERGDSWTGAMIVAPPGGHGTPWQRKFGKDVATAFASGWMLLRGNRRRRGVGRGFIMSDHADWTGLLDAIDQTGADEVWCTHGYTGALARFLAEERGLNVATVDTRYSDSGEAADADDASDEAGPVGASATSASSASSSDG